VLPKGPIVVLAHSGGFRTAARWTEAGLIRQLCLIDGLYSSQVDRFRTWLKDQPASMTHQLVLTSTQTADRSDVFAQQFEDAIKRDTIPDDVSALGPDPTKARLIYMRSQYEHMELVTGGKVIPLLLALAPLESLE